LTNISFIITKEFLIPLFTAYGDPVLTDYTAKKMSMNKSVRTNNVLKIYFMSIRIKGITASGYFFSLI